MKNKNFIILINLLILSFFNIQVLSEEFDFKSSEIIFLENGNRIKGINGIDLVTNNKTIDDIDKYQTQIEEIYNIIHLFCYWNNTQYTYHQRIEICKKNLKKILKYNNLKLITMIIEKIQQTHSFISYDNWTKR